MEELDEDDSRGNTERAGGGVNRMPTAFPTHIAPKNLIFAGKIKGNDLNLEDGEAEADVQRRPRPGVKVDRPTECWSGDPVLLFIS